MMYHLGDRTEFNSCSYNTHTLAGKTDINGSNCVIPAREGQDRIRWMGTIGRVGYGGEDKKGLGRVSK